MGAMAGMELVRDRETKEPADKETARLLAVAREKGLILLRSGVHHNVIRTLMPLTIPDEQLDEGLDMLGAALAEVAAAYRSRRRTQGETCEDRASKRHQMFIGGEWVDGTGGDVQEIINPATGEVIATVPKGTAEDVDRAVAAARKAYDEVWFDSTPRERSERLLKLADGHRGARRGARAHRVGERRQAARRDDQRRDPADRGLLPLLRRRRAHARGPRGRRVHEGLHQHSSAASRSASSARSRRGTTR